MNLLAARISNKSPERGLQSAATPACARALEMCCVGICGCSSGLKSARLLFKSAAWTALLLGILLCTVGCQSTPKKLGSHRVAAVVVTNATPKEIQDATEKVFKLHGFDPAPEDYNDLVFQRQGTFMNGFVYGDWYGGPVWVRIKVFLSPLDAARTLVDCDVYMVQDHEDPLFQQERKVHADRTECQKILDEIPPAVAQLKTRGT